MRIGRVAGIDLFVHWSWLVVAVYQIQNRPREYGSIGWAVAEYLALFGIVLLHELGHSLACRQVGGVAEQIILWPLGGVAYVAPPPRPGAVLWSIAAGPLVNAVLAPVLFGLIFLSAWMGWGMEHPDAAKFLRNLTWINTGLLVFNILPVYPLDGGQMLRALLWFRIGPVRSLYVVSLIGFAGVAGLLWLSISQESVWLGIIAFFVSNRCIRGFQEARMLLARERQWREACQP